jgi:hypothetical protein
MRVCVSCVCVLGVCFCVWDVWEHDTGQHMSGAGFPFTSYTEFVVHHVARCALRILQWVLLCAQITASPDRKVCLYPISVRSARCACIASQSA